MTAFYPCNRCKKEIKHPNKAVMVKQKIYHQSCTNQPGIPLSRFFNWFEKEVDNVVHI